MGRYVSQSKKFQEKTYIKLPNFFNNNGFVALKGRLDFCYTHQPSAKSGNLYWSFLESENIDQVTSLVDDFNWGAVCSPGFALAHIQTSNKNETQSFGLWDSRPINSESHFYYFNDGVLQSMEAMSENSPLVEQHRQQQISELKDNTALQKIALGGAMAILKPHSQFLLPKRKHKVNKPWAIWFASGVISMAFLSFVGYAYYRIDRHTNIKIK